MHPNVCVLKTDGINCDEETRHAFRLAGAAERLVHVNELREKRVNLKDFQILAIPGGFSYGDDIASGKILANELVSFLKDEMHAFIERGNLVIGICNGFQVLVQSGLLPGGTLGTARAALAPNSSGRFECRWVHLRVEESLCIFLRSFATGSVLPLPVAHAEGKFWAEEPMLDHIEAHQQVALRYVDENGHSTDMHPENPNGSLRAVAGVTDPSGRIFGLMPHPERYVMKTQYGNWRRENQARPLGLEIFKNAVNYAEENL